MTGCGWKCWSEFTNRFVPGQSFWYEGPSKSSSDARQPLMCTTQASLPGTQKLWSSSSSRPFGSSAPAFAQLKSGVSSRQCSKCPISSENEMFTVCADHVFPRGFAVLYSGWNAYGLDVHVAALGSNRTCANPLATDAVIGPCWCLVRSVGSA